MKRKLIGITLGCMSILPVSAEVISHGEHCALLKNDIGFLQANQEKTTSTLTNNVKDIYQSGIGTSTEPYILSVSAHYSEDSATRYSVKEIERIAREGVENFNLSLVNSNIHTLKAEFVGLVEIPTHDFDFSTYDTLGQDISKYFNDIELESKTLAHGNDLTLIFHDWSEHSGLYGLTGLTYNYAGINLAAIVIDELPKTIAHEMGHMMGAGHQLGTTTSGGQFDYSNAIYCERDDGSRLGSIVSAIEHSSTVLQFSSPDMECGEDGVTDNRQTIIELSAEQANYNSSPDITGTVNFTVDTQSIDEGDNVTVTFVRDGDISGYGFVGLWLESESLVPHLGYDGAEYRYIEFPPGEDTVSLNIKTHVDGKWREEPAILSLRMDYPTALRLSSDQSVDILINNLDEMKRGYIALASDSINATEGESIDVVLNRIDGSDGEVSVMISTEPGTASDHNFNSINEMVIFKDGETEKTIQLITLSDNLYTETVTLTVNITGDDVGGQTQTLVSILNSDLKENNQEEDNSGGSSGSSGSSGGSLGFGLIFILSLLGVRRIGLMKY